MVGIVRVPAILLLLFTTLAAISTTAVTQHQASFTLLFPPASLASLKLISRMNESGDASPMTPIVYPEHRRTFVQFREK